MLQKKVEGDLIQIALDLETTGLYPFYDRIVEIGCIKLVNFVENGEKFHCYINP